MKFRKRSVRSLRAESGHARWVLTVVAAVGIASTVRHAIAPPVPDVPAPPRAQRIDAGTRAFAERFAAAYLTWEARDPSLHQRALAPFLAADEDPDAGFQPPNRGSQRVSVASVVQARPSELGGETFTVAAQTALTRTVYLTVTVRRVAGGALQLVGAPAVVGAPASTAPQLSDVDAMDAVTEKPVVEVVERALDNYLAGDADALRADLAPTAEVALPSLRLELREVSSVAWSPSRTSVHAAVVASDEHGGVYQLAYELDVDLSASRPFVTAIQTNPRQ
ncbi:conjugal transfer protein [Conexibacter sp. JD483]|uniref:conjugal transfer protein n=1 Tax=Conexibacter sp. JD483 TaxID=3064471 RepID=UPI00271A7D95|nr:conjugal transfer protein [Conexibacter sp. JD483]MDO8185876.1 conjugal transfer protein [Conexibacter sp. CPCC 205706]MDR9367705.1 conjugal transfer protein [Conexibacter sp. JD483]